MASLFAAVEMAPRDPILGLTEQFNADSNPGKVNLGIGVYTDENGKLPLLQCVARAEAEMQESPKPRGYLPMDGIAAYDKAVQALVFGADSEAVSGGRVATVQALGGTGGLKVGADFLRHLDPKAQVLISTPTWENHRGIFSEAGFDSLHLPLLRRGAARYRLPGDALRAGGRAGRIHRAAARVLPQPDRLRPVAGTVAAGRGDGQEVANLSPSSTWLTKALATAWPKTVR